MINTKCITCGGDLLRKGNYYVCESCGNKWIIDVADDIHAVTRANAWEALRSGDFDKALELFGEITLKEPKNHEAFWGLALAENGIMYVSDLIEGKKIPTCNNITEKSFIKNPNVEKAISLAPREIADAYRSQAQYIEQVRVEWLEKASKEPPYDIFISFKDSDRENGTDRTVDSIDAQELYNILVDEGYKVFFSRISLRSKTSEQYEPYIYNALKTAKVMIVFGEKPEYFNSTWIKNEWGRFAKLIKAGEKHKNSLVVVYKNMDPGKLPEPLKPRQCLDYSLTTCILSLTRHIKQVIEESKKNSRLDRIKVDGGKMSKKASQIAVNSVQTREINSSRQVETSITEKQTVNLINTFLQTQDWAGAENLINTVLFDNPNCAEAIWCSILAKNKATDDRALCGKICRNGATFVGIENLEHILSCASKNFAEYILDLLYGVNFLDENLYIQVLRYILPFGYPGRAAQIQNAFRKAIANSHARSFDLLLTTLESNEVDKYIELCLSFAKNSKLNVAVKREYYRKILEVDEGNLQALRAIVDIDLAEDTPIHQSTASFEALLKYSPDANGEVTRVLGVVPRILEIAQYSQNVGRNKADFVRQILRYYDGSLATLSTQISTIAFCLLRASLPDDARYFFDLTLSVDDSCAQAYWGICLANIGAKDDADIVNCDRLIDTCPEYTKYLTMVDQSRQFECIQYKRDQANRIEQREKSKQDTIQNYRNRIQQLKSENVYLTQNKKHSGSSPSKEVKSAKSARRWWFATLFLLVGLGVALANFLNNYGYSYLFGDFYLTAADIMPVVIVPLFIFGITTMVKGVKAIKNHKGWGGFVSFIANYYTLGILGVYCASKLIKNGKINKKDAKYHANMQIQSNNAEIERLEKELLALTADNK